MDILNAIRHEEATTTTWNGDLSYKSTLNKNLDFFGSLSSMRYDSEDAIKKWLLAFDEDETLAIKNLFYARDIRQGAGNREMFRDVLVKISSLRPDVFAFIVPIVPELGRWDDLTKIIKKVDNKESRKVLVNFVKAQLTKDVEDYLEGKNVSLLAKWMPSLNQKKLRPIALAWHKELLAKGTKLNVYQKTLVKLRERIDLIETRLTNNDFTFEYSRVPAKASLNYKNTFINKDEKRYFDFLDSIKKDSSIIKKQVENLQPHEIVKLIQPRGYGYLTGEVEVANTYWSALDRKEFDKNILVVRDGSGSMMGNPLLVATSMAIYTSEQLTGPFANKFITFSNKPKLVEIPKTLTKLSDKLEFIQDYDEVANTDLDKTFQLLYKASLKADKSEQIDTLLIISDMEFDSATVNGHNKNKSTFDKWKEKFKESGLIMPKVIFWNVNAIRTVFPTTDIDNLYLVSGYSKAIMNDAIKGEAPDAIANMKDTLSKYDKYFQ